MITYLIMVDNKITKTIDRLNTTELRELYKYIREKLPPAVVYQQKPIRCGCKKCKEGGKGHGSYWYAYFTYKGKTHCAYVGKEKRDINPLEEIKRKNLNQKNRR